MASAPSGSLGAHATTAAHQLAALRLAPALAASLGRRSRARHACRGLEAAPRRRRPAAPAAAAPAPGADADDGAELRLGACPSSRVPEHWEAHLKSLPPWRRAERAALKAFLPAVEKANALEPAMRARPDAALRGVTDELRARLAAGEPEADVLPAAFAACREACRRVLGLRHYDVQLLGGAALAAGAVAEMATGEGKTLVAALPAYLLGLTRRGVHVVTVNDYLARRDAEWVGKALRFLGLTVGVVAGGAPLDERVAAFACDVTYVTAYELAFSFLRDHMADAPAGVCLRRPLAAAIVDEADSVLIDEARNPFMLNAPSGGDAGDRWAAAAAVARRLAPPDAADLPASYFEGEPLREPIDFCDFVPQAAYKAAALTLRGQRNAVLGLAAEGRLLLADDGATGAHYVVMVDVVDAGAAGAGGRGLAVRLTPRRTRAPGAEPAALPLAAGAPAGEPPLPTVVVPLAAGEHPADAAAACLPGLGLRPLGAGDDVAAAAAAAAPAALWDGGGAAWGRFIVAAVKAVHLYARGVDYLVRDDTVVIIDAATGRERPSSRWQDGLHQAVEAAEGVPVRPEDVVAAAVTYQALFGLYPRLAGMSGTAATEAEEFSETYGLPVVRVPPHRPSARADAPVAVYATRAGWEARLGELVAGAAAAARPVLVGAASVEASADVAALVRRLPYADAAASPAEAAEARALARAARALAARAGGGAGWLWTLAVVLEAVADEGVLAAADIRVAEQAADAAELLQDDIAVPLPAAEAGTLDAAAALLRRLAARGHLGACVPVNVLNATPELVALEAQTIAQAGLPRAVTVATPMAGRGTDVLLGGNPKGLTLMALRRLFPPRGGARAPEPDAPLAHLTDVFTRGEAGLRAGLPPPVWAAYEAARDALAAGSGAPGQAPPQQGEEEWPPALLEEVEMERAQLLLERGRGVALEDAAAWAAARRAAAAAPAGEAAAPPPPAPLSALPPAAAAALRAYALLQWLWFDAACAEYAAQVRAAGGLLVVVASLQESRRAELQLRGRSGRQGDPGETHYVVAADGDPALAALLPAAAGDLHAWLAAAEADGGGAITLPPGIAARLEASVTAASEYAQRQARDATKRYDAVLDPYRRHVYRLRRLVAAGGDAARGALARRHLARAAGRLVAARVPDAAAPPREWALDELMADVAALVNVPAGGGGALAAAAAAAAARVFGAGAPVGVAELGERGRLLFPVTDVAPAATAAALCAALAAGGALPPLAAVPGAAALGGDGRAPLRARAALAAARRGAAAAAREALAAALPRGAARRGAHAPARARLAAWLAELLVALRESQRAAAAGAVAARSPRASPMQAAAAARVAERAALLAALAALWSDFLQDATAAQKAASFRALTRADPLDEFRLEAAALFSRLLEGWGAAAAAAPFAGVDLDALEPADAAREGEEAAFNNAPRGGGGGGGGGGGAPAFDVEWAAEWVGRQRGQAAAAAAAAAAGAPAEAVEAAPNGAPANGAGGAAPPASPAAGDAARDALLAKIAARVVWGSGGGEGESGGGPSASK